LGEFDVDCGVVIVVGYYYCVQYEFGVCVDVDLYGVDEVGVLVWFEL